MNKKQITIEAVVAASPEEIWHCWTEPDHITKWNFASDDWHCPSAESDLKVGGQYKTRMEARDGSVGFDFEAVYDKISPHTLITYTMMDGRKSTTTFEAQKGVTKITTTFDAEEENPVDMQREGWQAILNNFKSYVEEDTYE